MELEKKHVHDVYNIIAPHFDITRNGYMWTEIKQFILNMEKNSIIADIGCGNGKNMLYRKDCFFVGCDASEQFIKICKEKGLTVLVANNLKLPFRDNSFDYVMSVAVIHHISSEKRRLCAIRELVRILKQNGLLFIQVWAFEQQNKKFTKQDVMIPWTFRNKFDKTSTIIERFYHLFVENELNKLLEMCNIKIIQSINDHENWVIIAQKN